MTTVIFLVKIKNLTRLLLWMTSQVLQTNLTILQIFLTVSRKFDYICLYIFHVIYPTKSIWQMILSQTKIFNVFPSTIQLGNTLKILISNCDRETIGYIPARDLWINWLYMTLSNECKHNCLTIDCRKTGPAKYRTSAESNF